MGDVGFRRHGAVGVITLDRPRALNALTLPMIESLHRCLDEWEREPGSAVVLQSASDKAFCAGGDIREIRQRSIDGQHDLAMDFFRSEYRLNVRLAELGTPVVSVIDGICMGGGLGLSVHGAFRVVTDRATLAMPETAIGFIPDVGATYFLSRLPGALGTYLGLTGHRLTAADAVYCGLATHLVADLTGLLDRLSRHDGAVDEVLRVFTTLDGASEPASLAPHRREIDRCFGAPSVAEIRGRLAESDSDWSRTAEAALSAASPQSLEVTMAALMAGKQQNLRSCLQTELDIVDQLITTHDFIEGVRAALVDKDRSPRWSNPESSEFDYAAAGLSRRALAQA